MRPLPEYIRRSPEIFYVLAAVVFVATVALGTFDLANQQNLGFVDDRVVLAARFRLVYEAVHEAVYIGGSGIMFHLLIAIWSALAQPFEKSKDAQ